MELWKHLLALSGIGNISPLLLPQISRSSGNLSERARLYQVYKVYRGLVLPQSVPGVISSRQMNLSYAFCSLSLWLWLYSPHLKQGVCKGKSSVLGCSELCVQLQLIAWCETEFNQLCFSDHYQLKCLQFPCFTAPDCTVLYINCLFWIAAALSSLMMI